MNGAQSLIRTLVGSGVDVCFGNPGTLTDVKHIVLAKPGDDVPGALENLADLVAADTEPARQPATGRPCRPVS